MYIVLMILIGLLVATTSKLLLPGRDPGGFVATIFVGVAGSTAAGFAGHAFGFYRGSWEGPGFMTSLVGAMLFLLLYRLLGASLLSYFRRS